MVYNIYFQINYKSPIINYKNKKMANFVRFTISHDLRKFCYYCSALVHMLSFVIACLFEFISFFKRILKRSSQFEFLKSFLLHFHNTSSLSTNPQTMPPLGIAGKTSKFSILRMRAEGKCPSKDERGAVCSSREWLGMHFFSSAFL